MRILLATLAILLLAAGCSSSGENGYYSDEESQSYEMENPYSQDSGHSAGYEWAERTGGNCTANSSSFNEGCEEYYRQEEMSGY